MLIYINSLNIQFISINAIISFIIGCGGGAEGYNIALYVKDLLFESW